MSKIAVTPNASGSGTFTLTTPGTDSNQTITLPNLSGVLQVGGSSIQSIVDSGNSTSITIDSSENVGIGTTTPNAYSGYTSLTLDNATNGGIIDIERNGALVGEVFTSDANTFSLQAVGARAINFRTNSSERLRIDSDGHLLHTLASQGSAFVPNTPTTWNALEIFQDRGVTNSASGIAFRSQSGTAPAGIVSVAGNTTGGIEDLAFMTASGNQTFERLRIDASGNISIGDSDDNPFSFGGSSNNVSITADGTNDWAQLSLKGNGTGATAINLGSGSVRHAGIFSSSGSHLDFATNPTNSGTSITTRMRVTAAGDVGIGTNTPHLAAWGTEGDPQQLHIDAGSSGTYGVVHISGKGTSGTSHTYSQGVGNQRFYMAYDETNGVHRMTIEPSGAVTMPTQPAFLAYGSAAYAERSNPMDYNSANYNIGNHYSTSTYLFTAPVAGRYLFTAGALKTANDGDGGIIIVQNSTNKARSYHNGGPTRQRTVSVVLSLSANDTVKVIPEGDVTFYLADGYGYFSGVLLG